MESSYQAITDLVAIHLMTTIYLKNQETENPDEASHQSDSFNYDELANPNAEQEVVLGNTSLKPTLAWRLSQIIRTFFSYRKEKASK